MDSDGSKHTLKRKTLTKTSKPTATKTPKKSTSVDAGKISYKYFCENI